MTPDTSTEVRCLVQVRPRGGKGAWQFHTGIVGGNEADACQTRDTLQRGSRSEEFRAVRVTTSTTREVLE